MEIVKEVVNPSKKTGEGKFGTWNLAVVRLEDGREVSVFGTPYVGQGVDNLEQNEYGWNGKLVKGHVSSQGPQVKDMSQPANVQSNEVLDALRKLYALNVDMNKKLDKLMFDDVVSNPSDDSDEPVDTSKIPF